MAKRSIYEYFMNNRYIFNCQLRRSPFKEDWPPKMVKN